MYTHPYSHLEAGSPALAAWRTPLSAASANVSALSSLLMTQLLSLPEPQHPHAILYAGQVRFHVILDARIENVGKSQSCMISKLRMLW